MGSVLFVVVYQFKVLNKVAGTNGSEVLNLHYTIEKDKDLIVNDHCQFIKTRDKLIIPDNNHLLRTIPNVGLRSALIIKAKEYIRGHE